MSAYRERVEIGPHVLYLGDCLSIIPTLSNLDGVIADPPYSSGGAFRGDRSRPTVEKYLSGEWSNAAKLDDFSGDTRDQRGFEYWSALWCGAAREACAPGAVVAVFSDWRQLPVSTDYLQSGGWIWRGVVPWSKPSFRPQKGRFGAQCEYLAWGSNGPMPVEREVGCLPGFFQCMAPQDREHVTEKPEAIMLEIVPIVVDGGTILDPFMRSGTTGVACAKLGRRFIGVEIHEPYFRIACRRIADAVAGGVQPYLFPADVPSVPPSSSSPVKGPRSGRNGGDGGGLFAECHLKPGVQS